MKDNHTEKKIAVLIDAENAQYTILDAVLSELSKFGHIIVKKAYGDWSTPHLSNWKKTLNELAINPIQQFSYTQGKNSSDAAMIIDAMDLLYSNKVDAFALVTSDSDFTKLASRLKESEIFVFGVGEKKTPTAFRNSCDNFILTEVLRKLDIEKEQQNGTDSPPELIPQTKKALCQNAQLIRLLRDAVSEYADDDGWTALGACGSLIKRQQPDFDSRSYGYEKLSTLIETTNLFDIDRRQSTDKKINQIYIRDNRA
ncbi:NYN domain-containing protein [Desulforhopalus sp. 52FAK]